MQAGGNQIVWEIMEHRGHESRSAGMQGNPKDGIEVSEWDGRISSLNSQQRHILENWSKTEKMLEITGTEEGLNQTLSDGAGALYSKLEKHNRRMGGFECLTENICGPWMK